MNGKEMKSLSGAPHCHECAPKDWRDIPNMTGDYDLDATIAHRKNPALPNAMSMYLKRGRAYHPLTGYSGYGGYGGDN